MTRTEHSMRNLRYALIFQSLAMVAAFITRHVFVAVLNQEYLGLDGTFSNLLVVLSLAELGVGEAITFSLYKPLAEGDTVKIRTLMELYRRVYRVIGLGIAALAALLAPFLRVIIKDFPDTPEVYLIYALFVANSVLSYFFVYKQSLILADQRRYLITLWRYGLWTVLYLVQAVLLWVTRNYILYLTLQLAETLLENWVLARKADRLYPFLKEKYAPDPLNEESKGEILRNTKAMFLHKIGGAVVFNTDSLLLSYFFGVVSVGLYSNYLLIIKGLRNCYKMVFGAFTGSVGNLGATRDKDHIYQVYRRLNFAGSWLMGWCSICLMVLFAPFLTLWVGEEYLFPTGIEFWIVVNFYITGMREVNQTFQNSLGLFWHLRYKSVVESVINLVVSVALAGPLGIAGIFIGTFVSTMVTCFWVEPYILFRYAFYRPLRSYFLGYGGDAMLTVLIGGCTWYLCGLLPGTGVGLFLMKTAVCAAVPNVLFYLVFRKREELAFFRSFLQARVKKEMCVEVSHE